MVSDWSLNLQYCTALLLTSCKENAIHVVQTGTQKNVTAIAHFEKLHESQYSIVINRKTLNYCKHITEDNMRLNVNCHNISMNHLKVKHYRFFARASVKWLQHIPLASSAFSITQLCKKLLMQNKQLSWLWCFAMAQSEMFCRKIKPIQTGLFPLESWIDFNN